MRDAPSTRHTPTMSTRRHTQQIPGNASPHPQPTLTTTKKLRLNPTAAIKAETTFPYVPAAAPEAPAPRGAASDPADTPRTIVATGRAARHRLRGRAGHGSDVSPGKRGYFSPRGLDALCIRFEARDGAYRASVLPPDLPIITLEAGAAAT